MIEEKLKTIACKLCLSFHFNDWYKTNVTLDNSIFPAVIYILPATGSIDMTNNNVRYYPDATIAFVDRIDFDSEGLDIGKKIEDMKNLAVKFIYEMNNSGLFEQIGGEIPIKTIYDKFDVNVAGVMIEIKIKETIGNVIC